MEKPIHQQEFEFIEDITKLKKYVEDTLNVIEILPTITLDILKNTTYLTILTSYRHLSIFKHKNYYFSLEDIHSNRRYLVIKPFNSYNEQLSKKTKKVLDITRCYCTVPKYLQPIESLYKSCKFNNIFLQSHDRVFTSIGKFTLDGSISFYYDQYDVWKNCDNLFAMIKKMDISAHDILCKYIIVLNIPTVLHQIITSYYV